MKTAKTYSYSPWSSDAQIEGDSEKRQLQLAQNWCRQHGKVLSEQRVVDAGVSGWRFGST